jgi:DNA polymerase-3 subunit delta
MVALKAHEADRFLKSPPESVRMFLVYGSDSGAITERARMLEQLALKRGGGEAVLRIGSDELSNEPGRVADEADSASLFGGEPVIALRVLDGRHNVTGALKPLFDRPPSAAWIVVEAGELNTANPVRKAFESSKDAVTLPTYELEGAGLEKFIRNAARDAGLSLDEPALEVLSEKLGGDRLAVRGEIEKLFLYAGDRRTVTLADVEAIVGDTTAAENDALIDAALLGDSEALELGLGRLRAESGSFVSLASAALRHLLQLQSLSAAMDTGVGVGTVLSSARPPVFSRRRSTIESELERWPSENLRQARREVDQAIYLTRLQPTIEESAISDALHKLALTARKLKRGNTASSQS